MIAHRRAGVEVPDAYDDADVELLALRTGVALLPMPTVARARLAGPAAWDVLDRVLPGELFLRDGQARAALLLDDAGGVAADATVVREGDDLWLLADGLPAAEVAARLRDAVRPGERVDVIDETPGTVLLEVAGPFAWELMAAFDEPGIVGQPYLTLARLDDGVRCLRAGRTGEYGYDLLVPAAHAARVEERLLALGAPLALRRVGARAAGIAALESGFFDPWAEGRLGWTPAALQLRCRTSPDKVGDAVPARRLVGVRGPRGLAVGDVVTTAAGAALGEVVVAAPDATGPGALGLAALPWDVAHAGLTALEVSAGPVRTVSRPFVVPRSLSVKPQRDRWATRDRIPWAPGTWTPYADAPPSTTSSAPTT